MLCWITLKKIYTSLAPSFWDCPPQGIRSMRRNNCPGSRDQLTCEWLRWEAFLRRPKMKMVSTVSLWISTKSFHKSSWNFILTHKLSLWVPSTSIFLFFFFLLFFYYLEPNIRVLKILERLFAFHFVPFSGSFLQICLMGSTFLRHYLAVSYQKERILVTMLSQECH